MSRFLIFSFGLLLSLTAASAELSTSFTLDGQLFRSGSSQPLLDPAAQIKVQILDPSKDCILYEETRSVDTTQSNGRYNLQIGSAVGSGQRGSSDPGLSMAAVYQNTVAVGGANAPGKTCPGGQYTPSAGDGRYLRLIVTPSATNVPDILSPDTEIGSIPQALVAQTLQGYAPNQFLILGNGDLTQQKLQDVFATGNAAKLLSLLSYDPATYVRNASNGALPLPAVTGTPVGASTGQVWYDAGVIKYWDGTTAKSLSSGSGITSLIAGTGLNTTEAPIVSGGQTLSVNVGTGANQIVQLDGSARLPGVDGSQLTGVLASGLSPGASLTTTGSLSASLVSATNVSATNGNFRNVILTNSASQSLTIQPPTAISGTPVFVWPGAVGSTGQVLQTDGSGVLSWVSPATSMPPSGTAGGDLSGNYPNPSVVKLQGVNVSNTAPAGTGQALRYTGTQWAPGFIGMQDLRSNTTGAAQLGTSCLVSQTLTYNSVTDTLACQNIAISASQVSGVVVNGGQAGAVSLGPSDGNDLSLLTAGTTRLFVAASGNVGIGTTSPNQSLTIAGKAGFLTGTTLTGIVGPPAWDTSYFSFQNGALAESAANSALSQSSLGETIVNGALGRKLYLRVGNNTFLQFDGSNSSFVNGNVGIGTTSPYGPLEVSGVDDASIYSTVYSNTLWNAPQFTGRKSRGTPSTPAGVQTDDVLFALFGRGYTSAGAWSGNTAGVRIFAAQNYTSADQGSYILFSTTPLNSTTRADRMKIAPDGNVGIGTTNPGYKLDVNGSLNATSLYLNGVALSATGSSGSVGASGGGVQTITQSSADAASAERSSLIVRNNGTSTTNEYNIIGKNAAGTTTFALSPNGSITSSGSISAAGSVITPIIYGSTAASGSLTLESTSNATKGNVLINPNGGNLGLGTVSPQGKIHITASAGLSDIVVERSGGKFAKLGAGSNAGVFMFDATGDFYISPVASIASVSADPAKNLKMNGATGDFSFNGSQLYIKQSRGDIGIGTATPNTSLSIYNANESLTLTDLTQDIGSSGLNIITDYTDGAYTPGLFWSTANNNSTKPKAGIWLQETVTGTHMQFGTSANYATGVTNQAMVISSAGSVGIGTTSPRSLLDVNGSLLAGPAASLTSYGGPGTYGGGFGANVVYRSGWKYINDGVGALFWSGALGEIGLYTTPSGTAGSTATMTERFRVHNTGGVSIGNSYVSTNPGPGSMILSGSLGIGTTIPQALLDVRGPTRIGNTYANIASYFGTGGVPTNGLKIKTNIPATNSVDLPTVRIEGYNYNYGAGGPIGLIINWYYYNNQFFTSHVSSYGSWAPSVQLAEEDGNVVIFLNKDDGNMYMIRFVVGATSNSPASYYAGWSIVDEAITGTNITTVPYKNKVKDLWATNINVSGTLTATSLSLNGVAMSPTGSSGAVAATGGSVQTITQTSTNAASASRSALVLRNNGTSSSNDYNLLGQNAAGVTTFSLSPNGSITSSGSISVASSVISPVIYGSTAASGSLTLESTSNATKGPVLLNPSGGNVGIGLSNPLDKLSVSGGGIFVDNPGANTMTTGLSILNSNNSATPGASILLSAIATTSSASISNNYSSGHLDFRIATRDSYNSTSRTRYGIFSTAGGGNIYHYWNKGDGSESMRLTHAGNLGIGVTAPSSPLHVGGEIRTSASTATITLQSSGGNDAKIIDLSPGNGVFRIGTQYDYQPVAFQTQNTERMRIDRLGNVGIGTTSPITKLHVAGSFISATSDFAAGSTGSAVVIGLGATTGNTFSSIQASNNGASSVSNLTLNPSGGNVGIGTAVPTATLHVSGTIRHSLAPTIYVDPTTGATSNTGLSASSPLLTLGAAFNLASSLTAPSVNIQVLNTTETTRVSIGISSQIYGKSIRIGKPPSGNIVYINWDQPVAVNNSSLGSNLPGYTGGLDILLNSTTMFTGQSGTFQFQLGGYWMGKLVFNVDNASLITTQYNANQIQAFIGMDWQATMTVADGVTGSKILNNILSAADVTFVPSFGFDSVNIATDGVQVLGKITTLANGNVGIGTASPSYKLDVNGDINVTGNFKINGTNLNTSGIGGSGSTNYFPYFTNATTVASSPLSYSGGYIRSSSPVNVTGDIYMDAGAATKVRIGATSGATTYFNNGSNVGIGTTSPAYTLDVNGSFRSTSNASSWSDLRAKRDIEEIPHSLEKILQLRGVEFNWRTESFPEQKFKTTRDIGVIAQEVEKVFPEAVQTAPDGYKSVSYGQLIAPVINAVKELFGISRKIDRRLAAIEVENQAKDLEIAELKAESEAKTRELENLKRRLEEIEKRLGSP